MRQAGLWMPYEMRRRRLGNCRRDDRGGLPGVYEKSVGTLRCVIAYAVGDETLAIVRVIHTAQDWVKGGIWLGNSLQYGFCRPYAR